MSRKLLKALGLLSLCLFIILGYNADVAADASQPLQVELDEHGQLSVKLWHWQQPFSPVFDYYHQYRVSDNPAVPAAAPEWGTWLTFADNQQDEPVLYHHADQALSSQLAGQTRNYLFGEGVLARHETDDYLDVSVTWLLAEHDLKLTQTVFYDKSAWHFSINWQIENVGNQVYENLFLTHGGHSHLYQQTRHRSSWDETHRRLILWPEDRWASGLMLMGGDLQSPVDHYYAGDADALLSLPRHQPLPDLTEIAYTDQGLLMQWHRPRLDPGEQWLLGGWQQFTAPVSLKLDLPQTIEAKPGNTVTLEGNLAYFGDNIELPDLSVWCLAPSLITSDCQHENCCFSLVLEESVPPVMTLGPAAVTKQDAGGFTWPVEVSWTVPDEVFICDCSCIDETNETSESGQQDSSGDNSDSGLSDVRKCESVTIRITTQAKHSLDPYTVFSAATDILITRQQVPEQPDPENPEPENPEPEPDTPDEPDSSDENEPSVPEYPDNTEEEAVPDAPQEADVPEKPSETDANDDQQPEEDPMADPEPEDEQPWQEETEDQQPEEVQPDKTSEPKTPEPDLVQNPKTGDLMYLQLRRARQNLMKMTAPSQSIDVLVLRDYNKRKFTQQYQALGVLRKSKLNEEGKE